MLPAFVVDGVLWDACLGPPAFRPFAKSLRPRPIFLQEAFVAYQGCDLGKHGGGGLVLTRADDCQRRVRRQCYLPQAVAGLTRMGTVPRHIPLAGIEDGSEPHPRH